MILGLSLLTASPSLSPAALVRQSESMAQIDVQLDRPTVKVSPSLYGIFFEEINQAGEGGIYAELLRNRAFEGANGATLPAGWRELRSEAGGTVALDASNPLNEAKKYSLRIEKQGRSGRLGAYNEGFWGLPIKKGARYKLTLWVKGGSDLRIRLEDSGQGALSEAVAIKAPGEGWKRIERTIAATGDDAKSRLAVESLGDKPVWVSFTSLMPADTWKGRANGFRKDLAKHVEQLKPAFVRFPGGCYVEGGDRLSDAFNWKASIGPQEKRPGLHHSMWGYPVSDGLGYHEYLQWCEDLGAEPMYVANCGMSHREIVPMAQMGPYIQDALDAIEYANGPVTSKWGALRAKNGHPKPFNLKYVEIGNENGASWSYGGTAPYAERYLAMFQAIKKAYPQILTIADNPVPHEMEYIDEHYYNDPSWFWRNANRYDDYDRKGPRIYVGEYAVTRGCGTGNLAAGLAEAAFMAGMERNSDIVLMSSYAPLFVNVNNRQWNPNAIVFDATRSYGTPSYWVQRLFSQNRADQILAHKVVAPVSPPPAPSGGIGLQTWRTAAEFKDLELEVDGKKLFSSAGKKVGDYQVQRGQWSVSDGLIKQTSLEENRQAMVPNVNLKGLTHYTLRVKARKTAGDEGFIVMFENGPDGDGLQWNVGGWGNKEHAFQRGGAVIGRSMPGRIENDRWYDIRIERDGNRVRGYLDGKLTQEMVEQGAPDFAAVAGLDVKRNELVLKVVNASNEPRAAKLNITGGRLANVGKAIVMSGSSLMEENTFESPDRIAPKETTVAWLDAATAYPFPARSVTILRIKRK